MNTEAENMSEVAAEFSNGLHEIIRVIVSREGAAAAEVLALCVGVVFGNIAKDICKTECVDRCKGDFIDRFKEGVTNPGKYAKRNEVH